MRGQPAFFFGEVSTTGGWPLYFPAAAALKWPLTVWALAAATLGMIGFDRVHPRSELMTMMVFPAAFFLLATLSHANVGDRYILPVYPFLVVLCAGVWDGVKPCKLAVPLVVVVIAVQAVDCLRYAPDYLSYFNIFVSPARSYELLTDGNLDWGQGLIALQQYQRDHPDEPIRLAYFGGVDPRDYGIQALPVAEGDRPTGTLIVSATHLSGQYLRDPAAFRWLLQHPEQTILNHSLHVFHVPDGHGR